MCSSLDVLKRNVPARYAEAPCIRSAVKRTKAPRTCRIQFTITEGVQGEVEARLRFERDVAGACAVDLRIA